MAWTEGFTSSSEILKTIARNACTLIKDASGELVEGQNWELIYPSPQKYRTVKRVSQEVLSSQDYQMFKTNHAPIAADRGFLVFRNGSYVDPSEYSVDYTTGTILFKETQQVETEVTGDAATTSDNVLYQFAHGNIVTSSFVLYRNNIKVDPVEYILDRVNGTVTFRFQQDTSAVITADYRYYSAPYIITCAYSYYSEIAEVTGEELKTGDSIVFSTQNGNLTSASDVIVYRNGTYVDPSEYTLDTTNGTITFGSVQSNLAAVVGEVPTTSDHLVYTLAHKPLAESRGITVYRDGTTVSSSEYTVDYLNGKVTFRNLQRRINRITQEAAVTSDNKVYVLTYKPIVAGSVIVYRNGIIVDSSEYTVNNTSGTITFAAAQGASDAISADYSYYGDAYNITCDYVYYDTLVSISDAVLTTVNYIAYSTGKKNILEQNLVVKRNGTTVNAADYTVDRNNGLIVFKSLQSPTDVITASFVFCPEIDYITANYKYYTSVTEVTGEGATPVNNQVFYTTHKRLSPEHSIALYKNDIIMDSSAYTIDYASGVIALSEAVTQDDRITIDYGYYTDGIDEAISAIKDRLVLKTTTTPVELTDEQKLQNLYSDERLNMTSLTMYVEFYKPYRLVNPETSNETYVNDDGLSVKSPLNHHYVNVRMFDAWDPANEEAVAAVYDSTGALISSGAVISPWSKFAWFQDWREKRTYIYPTSTSTTATAAYVRYVPTTLPIGLAEIPIRYWMNITNDRLIMAVMGEPSVNFDDYLIGFAYIGRIKPYEGGINDTFGNFALTTTSSTVPCKIVKPPTDKPSIDSAVASVTGGTLANGYSFVYRIAYITKDGCESPPSNYYRVSVPGWNGNTGMATINVRLPANAVGYKVYRYGYHPSTPSPNPDKLENFSLLAVVNDANQTTYVDDGSVTPITTVCPAAEGRSEAGIIRSAEPVTGDKSTFRYVVKEVNYPDDFGAGTATGVIDISMYRTRGGAYYQQHRPAFHTQEEFMTKAGFNPSGFTGKVYVSCISVVHPFDGYRGTLDDVVAVDATSLAPLDELVINKGQPDEEVYKFFAINAPYSFISASANSMYGIAIKKG